MSNVYYAYARNLIGTKTVQDFYVGEVDKDKAIVFTPQEVDAFVLEHKSYHGYQTAGIMPEDLEAMKQGAALIIATGEYTLLVRLVQS